MPLYSYHCPQCDADFETLIRSEETAACPTCGSIQVSRLLSGVRATGKTEAALSVARRAAAAEGHFSNYSRSELRRKS